MKLLTSQEKTVFRILMGTALFGLIVGFVRHNYFGNNERTLLSSQGSDSVIDDKQTPVSDEIIAVNHESTEEIDEQTEIKKEEITGTQITININTAGKDELVLLPNVGPVTAERIIRYREDYGLFDSIDDLTRVKGIGSKTLEKLKAFVTL